MTPEICSPSRRAARCSAVVTPVDLHWAVPARRVDTDQAFEAVYDDLARRVFNLADTLDGTTERPSTGRATTRS
jgi:hypothetical protein